MTDNKLQSLTEIFNEKIFRIPDFQRGYSWRSGQLEDFWEDIINLKNDRIHYTGLLTVEAISKKNVENSEKWRDDLWLFDRGLDAYYLIDGQQRLTTSIILINEILNLVDNKESIHFKNKTYWVEKFLYQSYEEKYKSYILGYERDNPSDEFFKTKILEQESSLADKVPEQTLYTSNLRNAKEFFSYKLSTLDNNQLEEVFKKITIKFKFNFYEIENELDVYTTFETMNNRGKPLSNLELLKNRLIYLSTLMEIDTELSVRLRKDINEAWKTIYEYLGKNKHNALDDDEFLRNHWIMYYKYDSKESESYAKFLLNEKFTASNVLKAEIGFDDIKNYIDSLANCVKSWFYIYNPQFSDYEDETKEWMQKLNRLGMSGFPPLLMAAVTKYNEKEFLPLFQVAEQFIFLVLKMSNRPANTQKNYFYRLANMLYFEKKYTNIDTVIGDVEFKTQGEISAGDKYEYYGWFSLSKFISHIEDLFKRAEGFYSWSGLKYFLYEYELFLQNKANGNQKITWQDFNKRKKEETIEHIYPQTPNSDYWTSRFEFESEKDRKKLLNNLGNLVLLAQTKNSELQNKDFDFKCKHKNKDGDDVGFFNGSYSEIEVSSCKEWTEKEILARGKAMLEFMIDRWEIEIEGWENEGLIIDKEEFLNLFC